MAMLWDNVSRIVWTSDKVSREYAPIMHELCNRSHMLEFISVAEGLRRANITSSENEQSVIDMCKRLGVKYKILGRYKSYTGFSHRLQNAVDGEPYTTYFAVARTMIDADKMHKAFQIFDNVVQGEMLGYPECCVEAFIERWDNFHHNDHVLDAALNGNYDLRNVELSDIAYTNQFFRYSGPRLSHHLPCNFHCKNSIEVGKEYEKLEEKHYGDKLLHDFLAKPFTASIYRGIIEVTSDVFRMISATDFTTDKYTITVK